MARYKISYKAYPNCAQATDYSEARAIRGFYLGALVNIFSLLSLVGFIGSTISLFSDFAYLDFIFSFIILFIFALVDMYFYYIRDIITDRKCQALLLKYSNLHINSDTISQYIETKKYQDNEKIKIFAKKFILIFLFAVFSVVCIIGVIMGIYNLCHKKSGLLILIISLLTLAGLVLLFLRVYLNHQDAEIDKLLDDIDLIEEGSQIINQSKFAVINETKYCRKCGKKIVQDSIYCAKCGTRL